MEDAWATLADADSKDNEIRVDLAAHHQHCAGCAPVIKCTPITVEELSRQPVEIHGFLKEYEDRFNIKLPPGPPPPRDIEFCIDLVDGVKPIHQAPYRLSPQDEEETARQLKVMMERELIREVSSEWRSPCLLVKKRDGGKRFCIDYCTLNKQTLHDSFPLPRIDELLDKIKEAKVFTKLDALSYFWQIAVREQDQSKLAFTTKTGTYAPVMMPFGVRNGPATAQ